jgi:tRNA modification GTPase
MAIKFINDDTIAAIITPQGEGGIGAIRIAGPESNKIISRIFLRARSDIKNNIPFHLYYGHLFNREGEVIDEVTMVEMPEGESYTGQTQAEIFCHGGQFILRQILNEIFHFGARPAEPGEFTRRAFLAGSIDLARAEAVADLVSSKTEYSYHAAKNNLLGKLTDKIDLIRNRALDILAEIEADIDYPEEDIEPANENKIEQAMDEIIAELAELASSYRSGKIIKEGYKIAIAGRPNAGKSSLFNLLLNQNRAIVAPVPGTTRDYLTEWIDLDGVAVSIIDTAGLRKPSGIIEKAGQKSAVEIIAAADLVIWIVDLTRKSWRKDLLKDINDIRNRNILLLFNKIDKINIKNITDKDILSISFKYVLFSCITKFGLKELKKELNQYIINRMPDLTDGLVITSERHKRKLDLAIKRLKRGMITIKKKESPELISFEIRQGINEIDEITGRIYNEEILDRIFSKFCIGK